MRFAVFPSIKTWLMLPLIILSPQCCNVFSPYKSLSNCYPGVLQCHAEVQTFCICVPYIVRCAIFKMCKGLLIKAQKEAVKIILTHRVVHYKQAVGSSMPLSRLFRAVIFAKRDIIRGIR